MIDPSGIEGTTHEIPARTQSISTKLNSYKNERPMIETKAIIIFSIKAYELVYNMIPTKITTSIAPAGIGIPNNICNAIAPPKISANEVETDATIADPSMVLESNGGVCKVAASERHNPVAMPKWATLC